MPTIKSKAIQSLIEDTIQQAKQIKVDVYNGHCDTISINVNTLSPVYGFKQTVGFNFRKNATIGDKWAENDGTVSECVAIV